MEKPKTAEQIAKEHYNTRFSSKLENIKFLKLEIELYGIYQQAKKSDEIFDKMNKIIETHPRHILDVKKQK